MRPAIRARSFVASVSLAIATSALVQAPASASYEACHVGMFGTEDFGSISASETNDISHGVRAAVKVIQASDVSCQYISSITVATPSGGLFEFGYVVGYWGYGGPCAGVSQTTYYTRPTLFNFRSTNLGDESCTFFADRNPTQGSAPILRASDENANKYWGSWYNGIELQPNGVHLDFTAGKLLVSMERGSARDTGAADFRDIFEHHTSNGWTFTEDVRRECDLDYQWRYTVISGHDGKTTSTSNPAVAC